MSWLSEFLGLKKIKPPGVKSPEELASMDEFSADAYLRDIERKSGYEEQIKAGKKKPMLKRMGYLGTR